MGTTTPTAEELTSIRFNLGALSTAFLDATLTALWATLSAAPNSLIQVQATTALCFQNALTQMVNYHDYVTGNTTEKFSQVFDNAYKLFALFKPALDIVLAARSQVAIGAVRAGRAPQTQPFDEINDGTFITWLDTLQNSL